MRVATPCSSCIAVAARRRRAQSAELLVVDQSGDGRRVAAHRTLRIAAQLHDAHLEAERFHMGETSDQRSADTKDELDRLERLHAADQARQYSEHTGFG